MLLYLQLCDQLRLDLFRRQITHVTTSEHRSVFHLETLLVVQVLEDGDLKLQRQTNKCARRVSSFAQSYLYLRFILVSFCMGTVMNADLEVAGHCQIGLY